MPGNIDNQPNTSELQKQGIVNDFENKMDEINRILKENNNNIQDIIDKVNENISKDPSVKEQLLTTIDDILQNTKILQNDDQGNSILTQQGKNLGMVQLFLEQGKENVDDTYLKTFLTGKYPEYNFDIQKKIPVQDNSKEQDKNKEKNRNKETLDDELKNQRRQIITDLGLTDLDRYKCNDICEEEEGIENSQFNIDFREKWENNMPDMYRREGYAGIYKFEGPNLVYISSENEKVPKEGEDGNFFWKPNQVFRFEDNYKIDDQGEIQKKQINEVWTFMGTDNQNIQKYNWLENYNTDAVDKYAGNTWDELRKNLGESTTSKKLEQIPKEKTTLEQTQEVLNKGSFNKEIEAIVSSLSTIQDAEKKGKIKRNGKTEKELTEGYTELSNIQKAKKVLEENKDTNKQDIEASQDDTKLQDLRKKEEISEFDKNIHELQGNLGTKIKDYMKRDKTSEQQNEQDLLEQVYQSCAVLRKLDIATKQKPNNYGYYFDENNKIRNTNDQGLSKDISYTLTPGGRLQKITYTNGNDSPTKELVEFQPLHPKKQEGDKKLEQAETQEQGTEVDKIEVDTKLEEGSQNQPSENLEQQSPTTSET